MFRVALFAVLVMFGSIAKLVTGPAWQGVIGLVFGIFLFAHGWLA
jgi:hypothetical protein